MPHHAPPLEKFELDGFEFDPSYYLTADYLDIESACKELPPIIEWLNEKLQTFIEQKLHTEQMIKRARAKSYFMLKEGRFIEMYNSKMTETGVAQAVELDESVIKYEDEYCKLYAWCHRLMSVQASLRDKLNLVRSAESTRRALINTHYSDTDTPT